jgi:hypothetical protein
LPTAKEKSSLVFLFLNGSIPPEELTTFLIYTLLKFYIMKNYFYCFLLPLIVVSCDSSDSSLQAAHSFSESALRARTTDSMPDHTANAYDYAGQLHNDVLRSYCAEGQHPTTLNGIREQLITVANTHSLFTMYFDSSPVPLATSEIQRILDDPALALSENLALSTMGTTAQNHFLNFVTALEVHVDAKKEYAALYSFITDYESNVETHPSFSAADKVAILHITSITRHAAFAKQKPRKRDRDLDWDWLITSMAGASVGSDGTYARGILTAVALDIATTDLPR